MIEKLNVPTPHLELGTDVYLILLSLSLVSAALMPAATLAPLDQVS